MTKNINKIAVLINTRGRPAEVSLLLQSLRTQIVQNFDIFIIDDAGENPLESFHFYNCMINRLKVEDHLVFIYRNSFSSGVSKARQQIVDWSWNLGYEYFLRVDDDIVLESDYIERLQKVLEKGYDFASGVTVPMLNPSMKRNPDILKKIINRVVLDDKGNYIYNGDDCGIEYTKSKILPCHHFRSCGLYKAKIHKKANYLPTKLSMHGFREEQIFSYKILMAGFTMGVDTKAINYHQMTPVGGERQYTNFVSFNQEMLEQFTKENKDKLPKEFFENPFSDSELNKTTNLKKIS